MRLLFSMDRRRKADDDELQYHEWVLSYVEDIPGGPQASVAWTLHESTTGWTECPLMCVAVVITLSIISVREGFLPDYLQAMLARLRDVSDLLSKDEEIHYRDDLRMLEVLMEHVPYEVSRGDEYWDEVVRSVPALVAK